MPEIERKPRALTQQIQRQYLDVAQRPAHLHLDSLVRSKPKHEDIFPFRRPLRVSGRTRDPRVP